MAKDPAQALSDADRGGCGVGPFIRQRRKPSRRVVSGGVAGIDGYGHRGCLRLRWRERRLSLMRRRASRGWLDDARAGCRRPLPQAGAKKARRWPLVAAGPVLLAGVAVAGIIIIIRDKTREQDRTG